MISYLRKLSAIVFLLIMGPAGQIIAGETMTIAFPQFYPFFEQTQAKETRGFFYDIITEALDKRMGIATKWVPMPWKRCQAQVKAGRADAMITVPTEERRRYSVTHQNPFYIKQLRLFTYAGHARLAEIKDLKTISDLAQKRFTVITYSGNGWHEKHVAGMGVKTLETSLVHNVWQMLAARRGDLVIEWPLAAYSGIKKVGVFHSVIEIPVSLDTMAFHLLISKQSVFRSILGQFNNTIGQMTTDGTMKAIISSYDQ